MTQIRWSVIILAVGLAGCGNRGTTVLVSRSPEGAIMGVVALPPFEHDGGDSKYTTMTLRESRRADVTEVLLRPHSYGSRLAADCFAVSTDGKFVSRRASLEEWDHADPEGVKGSCKRGYQ